MGVTPSENATALRRAAERGARRKGWRAALFLGVALLAASAALMAWGAWYVARCPSRPPQAGGG